MSIPPIRTSHDYNQFNIPSYYHNSSGRGRPHNYRTLQYISCSERRSRFNDISALQEPHKRYGDCVPNNPLPVIPEVNKEHHQKPMGTEPTSQLRHLPDTFKTKTANWLINTPIVKTTQSTPTLFPEKENSSSVPFENTRTMQNQDDLRSENIVNFPSTPNPFIPTSMKQEDESYFSDATERMSPVPIEEPAQKSYKRIIALEDFKTRKSVKPTRRLSMDDPKLHLTVAVHLTRMRKEELKRERRKLQKRSRRESGGSKSDAATSSSEPSKHEDATMRKSHPSGPPDSKILKLEGSSKRRSESPRDDTKPSKKREHSDPDKDVRKSKQDKEDHYPKEIKDGRSLCDAKDRIEERREKSTSKPTGRDTSTSPETSLQPRKLNSPLTLSSDKCNLNKKLAVSSRYGEDVSKDRSRSRSHKYKTASSKSDDVSCLGKESKSDTTKETPKDLPDLITGESKEANLKKSPESSADPKALQTEKTKDTSQHRSGKRPSSQKASATLSEKSHSKKSKTPVDAVTVLKSDNRHSNKKEKSRIAVKAQSVDGAKIQKRRNTLAVDHEQPTTESDLGEPSKSTESDANKSGADVPKTMAADINKRRNTVAVRDVESTSRRDLEQESKTDAEIRNGALSTDVQAIQRCIGAKIQKRRNTVAVQEVESTSRRGLEQEIKTGAEIRNGALSTDVRAKQICTGAKIQKRRNTVAVEDETPTPLPEEQVESTHVQAKPQTLRAKIQKKRNTASMQNVESAAGLDLEAARKSNLETPKSDADGALTAKEKELSGKILKRSNPAVVDCAGSAKRVDLDAQSKPKSTDANKSPIIERSTRKPGAEIEVTETDTSSSAVEAQKEQTGIEASNQEKLQTSNGNKQKDSVENKGECQTQMCKTNLQDPRSTRPLIRTTIEMAPPVANDTLSERQRRFHDIQSPKSEDMNVFQLPTNSLKAIPEEALPGFLLIDPRLKRMPVQRRSPLELSDRRADLSIQCRPSGLYTIENYMLRHHSQNNRIKAKMTVVEGLPTQMTADLNADSIAARAVMVVEEGGTMNPSEAVRSTKATCVADSKTTLNIFPRILKGYPLFMDGVNRLIRMLEMPFVFYLTADTSEKRSCMKPGTAYKMSQEMLASSKVPQLLQYLIEQHAGVQRLINEDYAFKLFIVHLRDRVNQHFLKPTVHSTTCILYLVAILDRTPCSAVQRFLARAKNVYQLLSPQRPKPQISVRRDIYDATQQLSSNQNVSKQNPIVSAGSRPPQQQSSEVCRNPTTYTPNTYCTDSNRQQQSCNANSRNQYMMNNNNGYITHTNPQFGNQSSNGRNLAGTQRMQAMTQPNMHSTNMYSTNMHIPHIQPTNVHPTNIRPTNMQPSNMQPTNMQPINMRPTNMQPSNMQPTITQPSNMQPINMQPTNMRTTNMQQSNMQPTNMRPRNMQPSNMQPTNMQPSNMQPTIIQPSNMQPSNMQPTNMQPLNMPPTIRQPSNMQPTNIQPPNMHPLNMHPLNMPPNAIPSNLRPLRHVPQPTMSSHGVGHSNQQQHNVPSTHVPPTQHGSSQPNGLYNMGNHHGASRPQKQQSSTYFPPMQASHQNRNQYNSPVPHISGSSHNSAAPTTMNCQHNNNYNQQRRMCPPNTPLASANQVPSTNPTVTDNQVVSINRVATGISSSLPAESRPLQKAASSASVERNPRPEPRNLWKAVRDNNFTLRRIAETRRYSEEQASSSKEDSHSLSSEATSGSNLSRNMPSLTSSSEAEPLAVTISIPETIGDNTDVVRLLNAHLADPDAIIDLDDYDDVDFDDMWDDNKDLKQFKLEVDIQMASSDDESTPEPAEYTNLSSDCHNSQVDFTQLSICPDIEIFSP